MGRNIHECADNDTMYLYTLFWYTFLNNIVPMRINDYPMGNREGVQ